MTKVTSQKIKSSAYFQVTKNWDKMSKINHFVIDSFYDIHSL
ncbi:hypothetical protein US8_00302 [Bacillus altitudinis]|nr:hypothetical protein US8_00302 [Bacillus altitudinis]